MKEVGERESFLKQLSRMVAMVVSFAMMMIHTCYNPTYNDWADGFQCESEDHSDGKSIIFKEVKE